MYLKAAEKARQAERLPHRLGKLLIFGGGANGFACVPQWRRPFSAAS
jgi:hypothetical protein